MFSLVPYAFSWTGVFNQDYIQEAARACFTMPKAVRDVRWRRGSRCRPGVCDEKRAVTSEESLQTAFNNRKYITRRIRLYASPNSASTRLVDGYLSPFISRPIPRRSSLASLIGLRIFALLLTSRQCHLDLPVYALCRSTLTNRLIDDLHDRRMSRN